MSFNTFEKYEGVSIINKKSNINNYVYVDNIVDQKQIKELINKGYSSWFEEGKGQAFMNIKNSLIYLVNLKEHYTLYKNKNMNPNPGKLTLSVIRDAFKYLHPIDLNLDNNSKMPLPPVEEKEPLLPEKTWQYFEPMEAYEYIKEKLRDIKMTGNDNNFKSFKENTKDIQILTEAV